MTSTLRFDRNGWIKMAATVEATMRAFGGTATPEEVLWGITSQLSPAKRKRFALTKAQVKRSMRYVGYPRTPGSNHYTLGWR